MLNVTF